jgi:hypothetical protein
MLKHIIGGQEVPYQALCDSFGACHIPWTCKHQIFSLFWPLKTVRKGQWFESTEKVTGKLLTALIEVSKNSYRNDNKSFMHNGKGVSLSKGTTVKEMLCE